MISYEKLHNEQLKKYQDAIEKYNTLTLSKEYKDISSNTCFDFLKILYLAKRIDIYIHSSKEDKPSFKFESTQEAYNTYNDLLHFKENASILLDKATLINQVNLLADKINNYVSLSDYLNDDYSLLIEKNTQLESLAKQCLQELPNLSRNITKELRTNLLIDMINNMNSKSIKLLAEKNIFINTDINELANNCNSINAKNNIKILCDYFKIDLINLKSVNLRLKGVTFNDDFGISRQDTLKELDTYIKTNKIIPPISIIPFIYTPELGQSEPAAKIVWNNKELGFLPKDVAIQLHNEYTDKIIIANINKILGGDSVAYGCEINLNIFDKIKENTQTLEIESELEKE